MITDIELLAEAWHRNRDKQLFVPLPLWRAILACSTIEQNLELGCLIVTSLKSEIICNKVSVPDFPL